MLHLLFQSIVSFAQEVSTGAVSVAAAAPEIVVSQPLFVSSLPWALIFGVLWATAELLAAIPSVKSSSVFTLIYNVLKSIKDKIKPA
jgi:hypothetical protein